MESLKGHFLIANSTILDPNFDHTVVLMLEHEESGAFGLIVNRQEEESLAEILDGQIPDLPDAAMDHRVFFGGPVQTDTLFILHAGAGELPGLSDSETGTEVIPGVWLAGSPELLVRLLNDRTAVHVFHGYAGWAPGQLEKEMESNSWIVHPASAHKLFDEDPAGLWRNTLRDKGGIFSYFAENVSNPDLN